MDTNQNKMLKGCAVRYYQLPTAIYQLIGILLLLHLVASALAAPSSPTTHQLPTTNYQLPTAFTNHAGHAVIGRLSAISNGVAVIGGRAYPLAIFPESEQARMRDLLQVPSDLPPALAKRRRALRERYLRNEALLKAGAKTPEAAARQRADLESAWHHTLDKADIDRATRAYWLSHLLD